MIELPTPETDSLFCRNGYPVEVDSSKAMQLCEKLEQERDWITEKFKLLEGCFKRAERERSEALIDRANGDIATMTRNHYERILRERDEAREEINIIRNTLSKNGEAVGNGEHDFSIIEMVENLIQSKDYFIRKSDSLERERDETREDLEFRRGLYKVQEELLEKVIKELKSAIKH